MTWENILFMRFELMLTIIIVLLLMMKIFDEKRSNTSALYIIQGLLVVNFALGFLEIGEGSLFNNMFNTNPLMVLEKNILNFGTLIISLQAMDWLKKSKHSIEFYILLLSTLLGMFLMISSGNFLLFYLGLELATIPLAALVSFEMEDKRSSEAGIKLILSSAFSSGILLFGLSMIYGAIGSLDFIAVSNGMSASPLLIMAFLFAFAGFAFKISIVPFHFWTADVYEGAPIAVTSYVSVISKGAIVFVFASTLIKVFGDLQQSWTEALLITSAITMTVGNLFAMRQNNIKRFLAFSSITQAGYILIGIAAANMAGTTSVIYFILIYIFSNLGAFGVVAAIKHASGKETINDYKGLYKTNPMLSIVLLLALFSLAGIPPTAGFFGKLFLLASGAGKGFFGLIIIAALNMVISLYYYLRVVKAMFIEENNAPIASFTSSISTKIALGICLAGILLIGFLNFIHTYIHNLSFGL